jgi:PTS system fructose-specific IIC component
MVWLFMAPMAFLNLGIADWLSGLDTLERVLLGALLGGMMAVDLGGPINKIAYTFGIIAIAMGNYLPAAATMAAGMVPPLALGLATLVFSGRYNQAERLSGRGCFFKGACFVTEGVISFARDNPLRVIPPCVLGAMVAGAISMAFRCELLIPHGGIFVIPLVRHWPQYCLAITSGVLLAAVLAGMLKNAGEVRPKPEGGSLGERHYPSDNN